MKVLIIDEDDCFGLIQDYLAEGTNGVKVEQLQPKYFLAPNPSFFSPMVTQATQSDIVLIHRKIWVDECESDDDCDRLKEFEQAIKPVPVLRVGAINTTKHSCPSELLSVYQQIQTAYHNLGLALNTFEKSFIGKRVKPVNKSWRTKWLTIVGLEMFGDNQVGCILQISETGEKSKYYKLVEMESASSF